MHLTHLFFTTTISITIANTPYILYNIYKHPPSGVRIESIKSNCISVIVIVYSVKVIMDGLLTDTIIVRIKLITT